MESRLVVDPELAYLECESSAGNIPGARVETWWPSGGRRKSLPFERGKAWHPSETSKNPKDA